MTWFIQRPIPAEFRQFTGSNYSELRSWFFEWVVSEDLGATLVSQGLTVNVGDWVNQYGYRNTDVQIQGQYQQATNGGPAMYALIADLLASAYVPTRRRKTVDVPSLVLLQSKPIPVTWDTPMPSSDYDVQIQPKGAATLVGSVDWSLTSQTASGCLLAVRAPLLALSVGQVQLQVTAST